MSDKIVSNLVCLNALASAIPAESSVVANADGLDAVVTITYTTDDVKRQVQVSMGLLTAAYVGIVKLWPSMKAVKNAVEAANAKAKLETTEKVRKLQFETELNARHAKLTAKEEARKAKLVASEAVRAARIEAAAKAKADRLNGLETEKTALEAKKASEAKKQAEEAAKKQTSDTAKAMKAAEALSKAGRLPGTKGSKKT